MLGGRQKQGLLVSTRASSTNVSKPENQHTLVLSFFFSCVCFFVFLVFLEQHLTAKRWEGRWGTGRGGTKYIHRNIYKALGAAGFPGRPPEAFHLTCWPRWRTPWFYPWLAVVMFFQFEEATRKCWNAPGISEGCT